MVVPGRLVRLWQESNARSPPQARPFFLKVEDDGAFGATADRDGVWNVLEFGSGDTSTTILDDANALPLVGHFTSILLPLVRARISLLASTMRLPKVKLLPL